MEFEINKQRDRLVAFYSFLFKCHVATDVKHNITAYAERQYG